MKDHYDPEAWKHWPRQSSQGLCETTLTERFHFEDCVCGTYPDNLGPCQTYLPGANCRCVYCDHKLQCHTAIEGRFSDEATGLSLHVNRAEYEWPAKMTPGEVLQDFQEGINKIMGLPPHLIKK